MKLAFLSNYDKYRLVYINHYFDSIVTKSILLDGKKHTRAHGEYYIEATALANRLQYDDTSMWCVCLFDDMLSNFIYSSQSWETKAVLLKTLCAMESSIELKLFYILITTFECEVIGVAYTQSKKVICLLKKKR